MSRLAGLFKQKNENVLNVYCTAGYPHLDSTIEAMKALQKNGADIIELGMPYSDPVADGPVIQYSDDVALKNGMTIKLLFEQLQNCREEISVPVVLMGYLNPVLQYGFQNFCADAAACGVDGLIIPDLPAYEFEQEYSRHTQKYGLDFIFLVTPETSEERVKKLDKLSSGFLYAVTSSSTTGGEKDFSQVENYLQRLNTYNLKNPLLAGFGIKDKDSFCKVCRHANGAIIGSAYVSALGGDGSIEENTAAFLKTILQ